MCSCRFVKTTLLRRVCIPRARKTIFRPSTQRNLDAARQARWEKLLADSRAENTEAEQWAIIVIQQIMAVRAEEMQKPGYFVSNRRSH
jgi:hypothetical protein